MSQSASLWEGNLPELKPQRLRCWYTDSELVCIIYPKFKSSLGKRLGKILGIAPNYRVKLDRYGSWVWQLCDGKTTVRDLGLSLKEKFGPDIEPLYPRLIEFLKHLEKNGLISYDI